MHSAIISFSFAPSTSLSTYKTSLLFSFFLAIRFIAFSSKPIAYNFFNKASVGLPDASNPTDAGINLIDVFWFSASSLTSFRYIPILLGVEKIESSDVSFAR